VNLLILLFVISIHGSAVDVKVGAVIPWVTTDLLSSQWSDAIGQVDGFNLADGDRAIVFIRISADLMSFTYSTSTVFTFKYEVNPGCTVVSVGNNCQNKDLSCLLGGAGVSVQAAGQGSFQVSKLTPGAVVIVRVELKFNCKKVTDGIALRLTGATAGNAALVLSTSLSVNFVHASSVLCCDDNNACTTDSAVGCSAARQCSHIPKTCDDGSACTVDSCNSATGECIFERISCDDGVSCTKDSCDAVKGCVYTLECCDDHNACTFDNCDPHLGCVNEQMDCGDDDACTVDACDPAKGCTRAVTCCCDKDACTADRCDSTIGCINEPISCNDNDACTDDSCDSSTGCVHTQVCCDDDDVCTEDWCTAGMVVNTVLLKLMMETNAQ